MEVLAPSLSTIFTGAWGRKTGGLNLGMNDTGGDE